MNILQTFTKFYVFPLSFDLILIFGFQLIIYPCVAHWVWSDDGWLKARGFLDFAGSGVVHCVGGFAALVGCILLGPRRGKLESHSMPLVVLGTFILWMGWFGFNGASSLSMTDGNALVVGRVLINTTLYGVEIINQLEDRIKHLFFFLFKHLFHLLPFAV